MIQTMAIILPGEIPVLRTFFALEFESVGLAQVNV